MKKLLVSLAVFCLFLASWVSAQDVAIMFDPALPVLAINDGPGFANLLVEELENAGLDAEIVDSDGLADYMEANPTGIMLVCQGIMPATIFENLGKDDLIYSWLREGGIGGFVGDYPFYYWEAVANVAAGGGQQKIFGVTVTNGNVSVVAPTELGAEFIPSLAEEWTTNRPAGLGVLEANGFEYESYADDGTNADPIAYRSEDMEGWFINFHTSCCGTNVPANAQMAVEYAELISNRFASELTKAVKPSGKMSTLWGKLKAND